MKYLLILSSLLICSSLFSETSEQSAQTSSGNQEATQEALPPGFKASSETFQATVKKVYSFEDGPSKFRAYVVDYKEQEIIAVDNFGTTDNKPGDQITVMAQFIVMPTGDKEMNMTQFMTTDFQAFVP